MQTYIELTPESGRSEKYRVEVKNLAHIFIAGQSDRKNHRIAISHQGMVAAWQDDAAYLSGPSKVESDLSIPFPDATAIGRTKRSLNMTGGDNAVFVPIGEAHPFVLHGRRFNRLEVIVK